MLKEYFTLIYLIEASIAIIDLELEKNSVKKNYFSLSLRDYQMLIDYKNYILTNYNSYTVFNTYINEKCKEIGILIERILLKLSRFKFIVTLYSSSEYNEISDLQLSIKAIWRNIKY